MRAFRFTLFALLSSSLIALSGCAGFEGAAPLPVSGAQVSPGAIHGSNFGGHAPIAGAHVFIIEVTDNGYGGQGTSRLDTLSNSAVDFTGVDQATTATPTVNPTFGLNFVPTDASGSFNFSGDYTCTAGDPLYLYAQGGSTAGVAASTASVNYLKASANTVNSLYQTVTVRTQTAVTLPAGAEVTLSGFKDVSGFPTTASFASSVVSAVSGSTSFDVTVPTASVTAAAPGFVNGTTYTRANFGTSVIATFFPTTAAANPQIVNLAMLGVCPGTSGEFANTLKFVYMNEVSTVAMAEAMAGFAGASGVSTDAIHIGFSTSTQSATGVQNAARNANQLFDIQGGNVGTGGNGDAHIARLTTPAGNGVVPQAMLDTLGNILAACVDDSTNTYNPWALATNSSGTQGGGTQSTSTCGTLFQNATGNGVQISTALAGANDTATAAFNIAHFPGGTPSTPTSTTPFTYNTTFVPALYPLQALNTNSAGTSDKPPFVPYVTSAPNDFSLAIVYSSTDNSVINGPESIAIDGSGNIFIETLEGQEVFEMSPLGVVGPVATAPSYTSTDGFSGKYSYGYISIDPSGNLWAGNANVLSPETELTASAGSANLSTTTYLPTLTQLPTYAGGLLDAYTTLTDNSGDIFIGAAPSASYVTYNKDPLAPDTVQWSLLKLKSGTWTSLNSTPFPAGFKIAHGAIDQSGNVWLTTENYSGIGCFTSSGANCDGVDPIIDPPSGQTVSGYKTNTALSQPEQPAIDVNGYLWVANQTTSSNALTGGNLARVVYTAATSSEATNTFTGGTMDNPFGTVIDGLGRIWVTNRCNYSCEDTSTTNTNYYFSSLLEFNGSGDVLSPKYNFRLGSVSGSTAVVPNPLNIAIDQSGVMWVTSNAGNIVGEVFGMAAPSYNPLSLAAYNKYLGTRP